mmetsp:Transcript_59207/g.131952  ORF Transcript_59207/g.131952 Transcript_59207/m.131952 type:complete len:322 (-) Transcript_59207:157-1122(-)
MCSDVGGLRRLSVLVGHVGRQLSAELEACNVANPSADLKEVRRQGHSVPDSLKQGGSSAVVYFENHARKLSHAEKARTMLATTPNGTLSTVHHESGWPYGSVVNFAIEQRELSEGGARLVTFVSRLAEHTANIIKTPRACLLVAEVQGMGDRLAVARAAFLVETRQVPKTTAAKEAFLAVHSNASYVHFDDFLCFELLVKSIRYIGGFGEMSWVGGAEFVEADIDPVAANAEAAKHAVEHCNEDHADAVLDMARAFAGLPEAQRATMLSVDRYGFDVLCQMPDGLRRSRVEFPARLNSAADLREAMVKTTGMAKEKLADGK